MTLYSCLPGRHVVTWRDWLNPWHALCVTEMTLCNCSYQEGTYCPGETEEETGQGEWWEMKMEYSTTPPFHSLLYFTMKLKTALMLLNTQLLKLNHSSILSSILSFKTEKPKESQSPIFGRAWQDGTTPDPQATPLPCVFDVGALL